MNIGHEQAVLRPNEGMQAIYRLSESCVVRVVCGCLTRELADGVIFPTNTAFAISGAAAAAIDVINNPLRFREGPLPVVFPLLDIKNPLQLAPNEAQIDLLRRPAVGEIGTAVISSALPLLDIRPAQGWQHLVAAFVRHQSSGNEVTDSLSGETIQHSFRQALQLCALAGLTSVVTVPFGAGLFGISAHESAAHMLPVIAEMNSESGKLLPEKITIVIQHEGQFRSFTRQARHLLK